MHSTKTVHPCVTSEGSMLPALLPALDSCTATCCSVKVKILNQESVNVQTIRLLCVSSVPIVQLLISLKTAQSLWPPQNLFCISTVQTLFQPSTKGITKDAVTESRSICSYTSSHTIFHPSKDKTVSFLYISDTVVLTESSSKANLSSMTHVEFQWVWTSHTFLPVLFCF